MKSITINLASGFTQSVDPRVAPNGVIARTQNVRRDRDGRLVCRNGYQSLGVSVQDSAARSLVPFDLHNYNNTIVALGNHDASQSGIRAVYQYAPSPNGIWKTADTLSGSTNNSKTFLGICCADAPRIVYTDVPATRNSDEAVADCAIIGNLVCLVSFCSASGAGKISATIVDVSTGVVVNSFITNTGKNPRVISVGNNFLLFSSNGTQLSYISFPATTPNAGWSGSVNVGVALGAAGGPFSVAQFEGTLTDFLVVVATGTGYTWNHYQFPSTLLGTSGVTSLANAPVDICGATGETVSVVNVKTNGYEIRTFSTSGGAALLGPTNLNFFAGVPFTWVGCTRLSSTQVVGQGFAPSTNNTYSAHLVNTATHVVTQQEIVQACRPFARSFIAGDMSFAWLSIGVALTGGSPYGLVNTGFDSRVNELELEALAFDGSAKTIFTDVALAHVSHVVQAAGSSRFYAPLIAFDARDKSYRASLVEFKMFSGERRQSALVGDTLYLAGGCTSQYDGLMTVETGFDTAPVITSISSSSGGGLTAGATYQYVVVFRSVASNKEVTQSSPSAIATVAMGANTQCRVNFSTPYSRRLNVINVGLNLSTFADLYRTEANGSIPRLVGSLQITAGNALGFVTFLDDLAADSVQQVGALLYTQGDTALSGRQPLALASPSRFVVEGRGKLLLGGLEVPTQMQLSIENRPGESVGFSNNDIYFVESQGDVTGLAIGADGRRFLFTVNSVREILGDGPNAAGIGELSDPIEIDGQIGCSDWRSIVKFELGILFRGTNQRIYLLPPNGSPIEAATGIRDILAQFPVTTACVRHDTDKLVSFSLQNAAGTDGRIVHLDLATSGIGKAGWVGNWIVDRVAAFEDVPDIQVLSESVISVPALATFFGVNYPRSMQVGDRVVVVLAAPSPNPGVTLQNFFAISGFANDATVSTNLGGMAVRSRVIDGSEAATFVGGWTAGAAGILKIFHLRGAHPSQAIEFVSNQGSGTGLSLGPLTPTWGAQKTLFIAVDSVQLVTSVLPIVPTTIGFNVATPGFGNTGAAVIPVSGANPGIELSWQRALLKTSSVPFGQFFFFSSASQNFGVLFAVRPAATAGTPLRAITQLGGALVVCNATDVQRVTAGSFADNGNVFISPEFETATIYAMGPGGAARHKGMVFVGEFRAPCVARISLSYDDGNTYTELTPFTLTPNLYTVGQTVRLQWVPRRRKVDGVRARFTITDSGFGPSEGLAFHQLVFEFEELLGPTRLGQNFRK